MSLILSNIKLAEFLASRALRKYPELSREDVRQEAKLALVRAARNLPPGVIFGKYASGWIRKSLEGYFLTQTWGERHRQCTGRTGAAHRMVQFDVDPDYIDPGFARVDDADELSRAIPQLTDDEGAIVGLVAEGCNYSKAGRLLMVSKTTVRNRLQRIRSAMKLIAVLLLLALPTRAAVTLSANATQSPGTLTIDVLLTSTAEPITGASLRLIPSTDGVFTLNGRDLSASPFVGSYTFPDLPAPLVTSAPIELGGDITNVNAPLSPGTYSLGRYTLTFDPAALGTYTITIDGDGFYQDSGNDVTPYSGIAVVTVTTPEPSLAWLFGVVLLRRRR